jgi:hypothetical protein
VCNKFGSLWPVPKKSTLSKTLITLSPDKIKFIDDDISENLTKLINEFKNIFLATIQKECGSNCSEDLGENLMTITFNISSDSTELTQNTNESYSLRLRHSLKKINVKINSYSAFGARHALETLGQLIVANTENEKFV